MNTNFFFNDDREQHGKVVKRQGICDDELADEEMSGNEQQEIPLEQRPEVMAVIQQFVVVLIDHQQVVVEKDFKNPDTGDIELRVISLSTFREYCATRNIDMNYVIPLLTHYDERVVRPPSAFLNVWRDFAYNLKYIPRQVCEDILQPLFKHMLEVWCDGDVEKFQYTIKWISSAVQSPGKPVGTALVLRGGESVSIGNIANTFKSLCGPHFRHLTTKHELTFPYNEWFEDNIPVFADKNTRNDDGDKQQEGNLKALVTEPHILVMKKFWEDVKRGNRTHLMGCSSSEWAVPVGSSDRRFFVIRVNSKYDATELVKPCETKVFPETRLCHLDKHVDLTDFVAPKGCVKSLLPSLDPVPAWLYSILYNGHLDLFFSKLEFGRSTSFTKSSVYEFFTTWCHAQEKRILSEAVFFKHLKRILPDLKDVQCSDSSQMIVFPPLEDARRYFSEYVHPYINILFGNNAASAAASSSSSE